MATKKNLYRKNFALIIVFLVLITVTLIIAIIISYNLTAKYVENEFSSKKIDVLEQTIKPYDDFFQTKIPEITFYQGFLDSASAAKYSDTVFYDYPFVNKIVFYEMRIGAPAHSQVEKHKLDISIKSVHNYRLKNYKVVGSSRWKGDETDFREVANSLNEYIAVVDTNRDPTQKEIFKTFYDIKPGRLSYLNIPRREEVKAYREIQRTGKTTSSYPQNMMTFYVDPYLIKIKNTHQELYKDVSIQPIVYDPIDNDSHNINTEITLPGAFSDYKLYFRSTNEYLNEEINKRFTPIGSVVLLLYIMLVAIGWLIYGNLNVNLKLFKLQYDFINNFTHEFKTPVSVIKIAGSNLKSDADLSERQRKHYGKILDEEADKLNELMNKLLSFTQLENKSIVLKREEIDIESLLKGYIDTFKIKYPDFKLNYKVHSTGSFYTDPVLLGSVFQNLIENAYKYSAPQKKELYINVFTEKRNIVFSFADKGIGIAKAEINNIFKKFYRIENQYNQNGSVGLGLAFCKELVNFMHGEITVESRINEGSEFVVTLPIEN